MSSAQALATIPEVPGILTAEEVAAIAGRVGLSAGTAPSVEAAYEIMTWLMGSLSGRSWDHVISALPFIAVGSIMLSLTGPSLDALSLGELQAESLGVDLSRLRIAVMIGTGGYGAIGTYYLMQAGFLGLGMVLSLSLLGVSAALFASGARDDLNIRGAFLHMAADALVSAGVVASGALSLWFGWAWLDPAVSLAIAVVIVLALLLDAVDASTYAVLLALLGVSLLGAFDDWLNARTGDGISARQKLAWQIVVAIIAAIYLQQHFAFASLVVPFVGEVGIFPARP